MTIGNVIYEYLHLSRTSIFLRVMEIVDPIAASILNKRKWTNPDISPKSSSMVHLDLCMKQGTWCKLARKNVFVFILTA